jgi:hypothetical protein
LTERSTPQVVNTHHFGGVDKLPSNTKYIGRPSAFGNQYSSKDGVYTREESIALHRVDLYRSLCNNPGSIAILKQELGGYDLACWCKHPKKIVGCHGDTYLHVLTEPFASRTYDQAPLKYLMDDLRFVLNALSERILKDVDISHYLFLHIHLGDVKLDIQYVLGLVKKKAEATFVDPDTFLFFLATLVIDLELALVDPDMDMVEYRLHHVFWNTERYLNNRTDRLHEPMPPTFPLKTPKPKRSKE